MSAWAQPADRDPLNAQTTPPLFTYQSAFSDYKPYQDPELMPWKMANDVVREFGGMAGMGAMEDMKGADSPVAKPGEAEPANQPVKPSHDMSNMKPEASAPGPKKPATTGSKPADMKNMPGHDMSKMQGSDKAKATPKAPPARGMKDKGGMADMPGHDMDSMQQKVPPAAKAKSPPPLSQPAPPMPGHGGMSH